MNKLKTIKALKPGKKMLSLMLAAMMVMPNIMYSISAGMADVKAVEAVPVEEGANINDCFPDDAFAQYVYETILGQSDYAANGSEYELTSGDVSKITTGTTEINLNFNTSVKDLTGIENFKALETLWCFYTGITKLDVSGNTALKDLRCSYTEITELDVTKNIALERLECHNTGITKLDVTKNTALTALHCANTEITALDVSNNTALETLYCNNTNITSLDVTKNTALVAIACYDTPLTKLDVSQNTELSSLRCNNTNITELDVSNLSKLTRLECNNAKLKSLNLEGKSFASSSYLSVGGQAADFEYIKISDTQYQILGIPTSDVSDLNINGENYTASLDSDIIVSTLPTSISYNYDTKGTVEESPAILDVTSDKIYNKGISISDEDKGISLVGPIEDSASLNVEEVTTDDNSYQILIESMGDHEEILMSVDVSIVGGTYNKGTEMTLTFSVDPQYNGKTVIIKHLLADGTIETYTDIVSDGKVQITVTELSPFMIALAKETQNPNPGEENPGEENPGEENPGEENPGEENPGGQNQGQDSENNNSNQDNENDYDIVSYGSEYQTGDNTNILKLMLILTILGSALTIASCIVYRRKSYIN